MSIDTQLVANPSPDREAGSYRHIGGTILGLLPRTHSTVDVQRYVVDDNDIQSLRQMTHCIPTVGTERDR